MSEPFYYVDESGDGEWYCIDCGMALLRADYPSVMSEEDEEDFQNGIDTSHRIRDFTDRPLQCFAGAECCNAIKARGHTVGVMLNCQLSQEGVEWLKSREARKSPSYQLWLDHYGVKIGLKIFTGD